MAPPSALSLHSDRRLLRRCHGLWRNAPLHGAYQLRGKSPGPGQVLARTQVSLISRGSELWQRYEQQRAVDPERMGYSTTGIVHRVGEGVTAFAPGDRVVVSAPHGEYTLQPLLR